MAAIPSSKAYVATVEHVAVLAAAPAVWDALVARTVEPSPFFSRHVLMAHQAQGLCPPDLAAVVVRDAAGQLQALLPFVLQPTSPLSAGGLPGRFCRRS